jgi:putative flippase GtrA
VIVGALAFACDITMLYLCTDILGWHYLLSNVVSYGTGLVVSYWLNITWVFSYRRLAMRSWLEFLLFTLIVLLGLGISEALMALLVEVAELHYLVSKVLSVPLKLSEKWSPEVI